MGILDAGMRIAARFNSHCPQTSRMYYHPPPPPHSKNVDKSTHHREGDNDVPHRVQGSPSSDAAAAVFSKAVARIDSADFILYAAI